MAEYLEKHNKIGVPESTAEDHQMNMDSAAAAMEEGIGDAQSRYGLDIK